MGGCFSVGAGVGMCWLSLCSLGWLVVLGKSRFLYGLWKNTVGETADVRMRTEIARLLPANQQKKKKKLSRPKGGKRCATKHRTVPKNTRLRLDRRRKEEKDGRETEERTASPGERRGLFTLMRRKGPTIDRRKKGDARTKEEIDTEDAFLAAQKGKYVFARERERKRGKKKALPSYGRREKRRHFSHWGEKN